MTLKSGFPGGSVSLKVTPVNSSSVISYKSLIVPEAVSCTVDEIIAFDRPKIALFK